MECTKCDLYKTRTNIVKGYGNISSKIIFIGEAPGYHEDKFARPFVGQAGKVFTSMLSNINLTRNDIYLTNVIKCRPPKNRNPTDDEISICGKHLDNEIEQIKPKIIVPMGTFATKYILGKNDIVFESMSKSRGVVILKNNFIIYPIFHPAALIYNNELQPIMKEDMRGISLLLRDGDVKNGKE